MVHEEENIMDMYSHNSFSAINKGLIDNILAIQPGLLAEKKLSGDIIKRS